MLNKSLLVVIFATVGFACAFNLYEGVKPSDDESQLNPRFKRDEADEAGKEANPTRSNTLLDKLRSWKDYTLEKLGEIKGKVTSSASDKVKEIKELFAAAKDKVVSVTEEIGSSVVGGANKLKDALKKIAIDAGETASSAANKVKTFVQDVFSTSEKVIPEIDKAKKE